MMWGYQGTEQRCIRILAPGSTIDRTLMTVDLWRNIILKLVRSLLCLESIKWKMTRNYGENIYRMSQKKYLVKKSIVGPLGLLFKMVQTVESIQIVQSGHIDFRHVFSSGTPCILGQAIERGRVFGNGNIFFDLAANISVKRGQA